MNKHLMALAFVALGGCGGSNGNTVVGVDPSTAAVVSVDRFQDSFAHLFKRSGPAFDPQNVSKVVPAPNAPIHMDDFTVHSIGPAGERVLYYSLDILPVEPGVGYVLLGSDGQPVPGQLPIVNAVPGDAGYNDFVRITEVTTTAGYVANTITSVDQITAAVAGGKATMKQTPRIANWALVPRGTTASLRYQGQAIVGYQAWLRGEVASYLRFETDLQMTSDGKVPLSGIVVVFKNDMSPAAGFATEADGVQTHNALQTLPGQTGYSSLWAHSVGKLAGFDSIKDWPSAMADGPAMPVPVNVNCPVVSK